MDEANANLRRRQKAQKLVTTWLTHCQNLSGNALSLRCGAGVCAEYALEKVLKMYNNDIKDADVRRKAGLLMEMCKTYLSGGAGYDTASLQGLREMLDLGLKTFGKADALEKSGSTDYSVVRRMYYNAWEFLEVVAHGLEQRERKALSKGLGQWTSPEWCDGIDIKGKIRYSMWRATEIWKAEKEGRVPVAPGDGGDQDMLEEWLLSDDGSDIASNVRNSRDFVVGQNVLYSRNCRSYDKVPGTVVKVAWNDKYGKAEYDIKMAHGGTVVKKVSNEFLSPLIDVGESVFIKDGSVEAKIEDVDNSAWPPSYLVLTSSQSLEEVGDEDVFFRHNEDKKEQRRDGSHLDSTDGDRVNDVVLRTEHLGVLDDPQVATNTGVDIERKEDISPCEVHNPSQEQHYTTSSYSGSSTTSTELNAAETISPPEKGTEVEERIQTTPKASPRISHKSTQVKYKDDVESMCKGEKLCKSALSALSFGDVTTAVRYLREALDTLEINSK